MNFNIDPKFVAKQIKKSKKSLADKARRLYPYCIENWDEELIKVSLTRKGLEMPKPVLERLLDEKYSKWPQLEKLFEGLPKFVRLGGVSPKDYLTVDVLPEPVYSPIQALHALMCSDRTFQIMAGCYHAKLPVWIWISEFIKIDPKSEWRVIVKDAEIKGISQYYYMERIKKRSLPKIQKGIIGFLTPLLQYIPSDATVDIIFGDPIIFLEMNPLYESDLCLFDEIPNKFEIRANTK